MPSIADHLERQLSPEQLRLLRDASAVAEKHEVELYLVGGTVRDVLLGRPPADIDVTAAGGPADLVDALATGLAGEVVSRSQFGTAKLAVEELTLDLAAARTESYAHPGALPEVSPGTMQQDLARRDFTVNAMAANLAEREWGRLIDPRGGAADLRAGLIRVLHAGSFVDDATRIVRAVRYSGRLDFEIEPETRRFLARDLHHLDGISGDRVLRELEFLFAEGRWTSCVRLAQDNGVLEAVHPALALDPAALELLSAHPDMAKPLRLSATLSFAPPEQIEAVVSRLNMSGRWAAIARDVATLAGLVDSLDAAQLRRAEAYRLLSRFASPAVEGVALACGRPRVVERLRLYLDELQHVRTILGGNDLLALGVPEGPQIGQLLDALLDGRLEGLVSTREDEETYVQRSLPPE